MPRVTLPDSCSHAGYLGVSTLHTFKINIILPASSLILKTIEDFFIRHTFLLGIIGYWTLLIEASF
jgi:hypothetical protein